MEIDVEGDVDRLVDGDVLGDAEIDGPPGDGLALIDVLGLVDGEVETEGDADGLVDGDVLIDVEGEVDGEVDGEVETEGELEVLVDGDVDGDAEIEVDGLELGEVEIELAAVAYGIPEPELYMAVTSVDERPVPFQKPTSPMRPSSE